MGRDIDLTNQGTLDLFEARGAGLNKVTVRAQAVLASDTTLSLGGIVSSTWDPGSLTDGISTSTDITFTGAELGDFVIPSFSLDTEDLLLTAAVTATDTVTVTLANVGATSPTNLASGTIRLLLIKAS